MATRKITGKASGRTAAVERVNEAAVKVEETRNRLKRAERQLGEVQAEAKTTLDEQMERAEAARERVIAEAEKRYKMEVEQARAEYDKAINSAKAERGTAQSLNEKAIADYEAARKRLLKLVPELVPAEDAAE